MPFNRRVSGLEAELLEVFTRRCDVLLGSSARLGGCLLALTVAAVGGRLGSRGGGEISGLSFWRGCPYCECL